MHIPTNSTNIPLQRCLDLEVKLDTPKGLRILFCVRFPLPGFWQVRSPAQTGRGVFATKDIPAGTVIDVCPVLVLGLQENKKHIEHTSLYHFT